ncbi:MAG: chromosome segregation protein SMC [Gemmatimonadaceae bacterium]|nr:chromosome segregation protein SMC [Gemmatimonadaceae bacterium]
MRLTKLELHGFKSFADSTELLFEPGVTAVVGPNGCGKSNVSDAVRWVLGEQRARALRGAKMDEVIFQGSSARRAVNVAEVSLHFDNDAGILDVPFREVVITRRLSRSGESDYFLNKAPCRLRDIHDLLRGTGLGADSGVVIESKMIDALLSDRPDDRRELFEEAAGIGLYRDRKRSTERRLEETATDLSRLEDLISEVQTQVRSLARQRKRSERHSELMTRRFTVEVALAARETDAWRDELARLEERVALLRGDVPAEEEAVVAAEGTRDASHGARAAAEGERGELARLVMDLRENTQQLRKSIAVAEERQRNSETRRQRAQEERQEGSAVASRVSDDLKAAATERARLEDELREYTEAVTKRVAEEESVRAALASARNEVDKRETELRDLQERVHRLTLDRQADERELQDIATRRDRVGGEQLTLFDAAEAVHRELAEANDAVEHARERASEAALSLEAARASARRAREDDANARSEMLRLDELHSSLEAKMHALEGLERERVGLAPAAAKLLEERETFGDGAILGPLSDFIRADSAAAGMVERYLGPSLNAVLVRDMEAAERVRLWHAANNPGPLLLLPLDRAMAIESAIESGDIPGDLLRLVQSATPADKWVRVLLAGVIAEQNGTAFSDSRGAVWLPGNVVGPGPLRRRAEIEDLHRGISESEGARLRASASADTFRSALGLAELSVGSLDDVFAAANRELAEATDRVVAVSRSEQRANRELAEARTILAKLGERDEELQERIRIADRNLADAATTVDAKAAEIVQARAELSGAEHRQEESRDLRTVSQVTQAQAHARLQVAADRERHLNEEYSSASARLASLENELSHLSAADSELATQLAEWNLDLSSRDSTLNDAEGRLASAELAVTTADEALIAAERALDERRKGATALNEELHGAELRLSDLSGRRTAIRERLETEWRRPLEDLLNEATTIDASDDDLRVEAAALREQLDALGAVNPLAIEEHEEEQKRLEFLTTQRDDLYAARLSLQQAIREIDATARDLFLTTFVQVRENFRSIFITLFGGGECDLRLENPESPLDGDIEIHASPRGKRTQRIHLLSSGERALVALSLLFGIFLTKPSPFCLLDEVDAPLDDANIGRFVTMLNRFKERTQFIVITHNPRTTTEAADAVYGVTMQEPGVSSIVSVRMRGAAIDSAIAGEIDAREMQPAVA